MNPLARLVGSLLMGAVAQVVGAPHATVLGAILCAGCALIVVRRFSPHSLEPRHE
jgi:hypothetical protein